MYLTPPYTEAYVFMNAIHNIVPACPVKKWLTIVNVFSQVLHILSKLLCPPQHTVVFRALFQKSFTLRTFWSLGRLISLYDIVYQKTQSLCAT